MKQLVKLLIPNSDQTFSVNLDQQNDDQELLLLFLGRGKEEYQIDATIHHQANATNSLTTIRGVLLDQSKAIINGLIKIDSKVGQTQAFLEEKVLLIGQHTQAQALPKLEIQTDDVKASHAASVGRLDEEEIFYLQSRGLLRKEAQALIIQGFFQSVINKIEDKEARSKIMTEIERKLL